MSNSFAALFEHIENDCDYCSWAAGRFCAKARALLDAAAQHAADRMMPVSYLVPRPKAKA